MSDAESEIPPWGKRLTLPAAAPSGHPQLDTLIATLEVLRAPGGCAWDREQTHESLVRYLIEETHELVEAIEAGTRADLIEELGDVLYQVVFHSDIAANAENPADRFGIEDVAAHMTAKMIGRHPHVFGDVQAGTADEVVALWDDIKRVEKSDRTSALDGMPMAMPSLLLAEKLIGKAQKAGVAVPEISGLGAVSGDEEFLGRELLAIVASARTLGFDAERALRSALRALAADIRGSERSSQLE